MNLEGAVFLKKVVDLQIGIALPKICFTCNSWMNVVSLVKRKVTWQCNTNLKIHHLLKGEFKAL